MVHVSTYYEEVGGHETFRRITERFYQEVARDEILKPMYPEDACLQMELLGHSFLLFLSNETGKVCVVYKRHEGDYGLLEPEY